MAAVLESAEKEISPTRIQGGSHNFYYYPCSESCPVEKSKRHFLILPGYRQTSSTTKELFEYIYRKECAGNVFAGDLPRHSKGEPQPLWRKPFGLWDPNRLGHFNNEEELLDLAQDFVETAVSFQGVGENDKLFLLGCSTGGGVWLKYVFHRLPSALRHRVAIIGGGLPLEADNLFSSVPAHFRRFMEGSYISLETLVRIFWWAPLISFDAADYPEELRGLVITEKMNAGTAFVIYRMFKSIREKFDEEVERIGVPILLLYGLNDSLTGDIKTLVGIRNEFKDDPLVKVLLFRNMAHNILDGTGASRVRRAVKGWVERICR